MYRLIRKSVGNILINFMNIFPIKNNKIFMFSYYGGQYGDNPKYITEYILNNYPKEKFDIVWAFTDLDSKKDLKGIRKVKVMTLRYFYELCTSKVIITNFRTNEFFKKRKKQYYIQTWHSSLRLKKIEKDAEKSLDLDYIDMAKKDSKKIDLLISGCRYSTEIFKKSFWYKGDILECGTPRNDILVNCGLEIDRIKNKLNIKGKRVLLYAPTFRKDGKLDVYNINYDKVLKSLEHKYKEEWIILVKLHPHLINKSNKIRYSEKIIDVTAYDDIQELLAISDILISDYSSLIFDYLVIGKPCFLYIPDIKDYISKDRNLYFDIEKLPFINVKSNDELINKIINFNEIDYKRNIKKFSEYIGSYEEGRANEELVKKIEGICFS